MTVVTQWCALLARLLLRSPGVEQIVNSKLEFVSSRGLRVSNFGRAEITSAVSATNAHAHDRALHHPPKKQLAWAKSAPGALADRFQHSWSQPVVRA